MPAENLLPFKAFAKRLYIVPRTLERWYERGGVGLPRIIRLGSHKFVAESEADRFIAAVIKEGGAPGIEPFAPRGAAAEASRQKAAKSRAATKPTRRVQHA